MRNSRKAFAPSGFGQASPSVIWEFLGSVNWTIGFLGNQAAPGIRLSSAGAAQRSLRLRWGGPALPQRGICRLRPHASTAGAGLNAARPGGPLALALGHRPLDRLERLRRDP